MGRLGISDIRLPATDQDSGIPILDRRGCQVGRCPSTRHTGKGAGDIPKLNFSGWHRRVMKLDSQVLLLILDIAKYAHLDINPSAPMK